MGDDFQLGVLRKVVFSDNRNDLSNLLVILRMKKRRLAHHPCRTENN